MANVSSLLLLGFVLGVATSTMARPLDRAPALGFDSPAALRQTTKRTGAVDQITQRLEAGAEDTQADDEDEDQRDSRNMILAPTANVKLPTNKRWVVVLVVGNSTPGHLQPLLLSGRGPPLARTDLRLSGSRPHSPLSDLVFFTNFAGSIYVGVFANRHEIKEIKPLTPQRRSYS